MMLHIYFPGMSPLNMNELKEFSDLYESKGWDYYAHEYAHWKDDSLQYDKDREIGIAKEAIARKENVSEFALAGKSIGTYTAVALIEEMNLNPKYVFLMGIPTGIGEDKLSAYSRVLSKLNNTKIVVIQNSGDPYGPMDEVKKVLEGVNYELIIKEGDNHLYSYAPEVGEMIM